MGYLIGLILILSCSIASYWEGMQQGENKAMAANAKIESVMTTEFTKQQKEITNAIANIRTTNTTIYKKVETAIIDKPVYRDCVHDADVLRDINAAIANPGKPISSGKPTGDSMPRTNSPR